MHKFEYEIRLNDSGRPYIEIPPDYVDNPEDKFMAIELSCYLLHQLINTRKESISDEAYKALEISFEALCMISDEISAIIKKQMEGLGEVAMIMKYPFHIQVKTIEERDRLNYKGIIRGENIFRRIEGLRVLVIEEGKIYELRGGIDNENWIDVSTGTN